MQNSQSALVPGGVVETRGQEWRLLDQRPFERCTLVTLRGLGRRNTGETLRLLTPFDRLVVPRRDRRLRAAGGRAVASRVASALLDAHPWLACSSALAADIDLLPWQMEPVLAVLNGATRVLLADAVGLGKTVQAALILAELSSRALVERTLILTPAGLRTQWADELAARLHLQASVLDQAALAREAAQLPADVNPWSTAPIVISSIDLVKRPETLLGVERVPFDLLIVDEAHHLTPDSDRGVVVDRLARRTPWIVLISATPHSGDERAFAFLRSIGAVSDEPLHIFRRTAPIQRSRPRSRLVRVTASEAERALLDGIRRYTDAIWSTHGKTDAAARLVAILLARRACSTAEAVLVSLLRRRTLLGTAPVADGEQPSLPWEELDARDGDEAAAVLAAPGLSSLSDERAELDRLIDLARRACAHGAKATWIERFIGRAQEPAIVFSEYRDSIEALKEQFEPVAQVAVLHGGLSPTLRRMAVSAFVNGAATILLATDAAGEGLNLHTRCRLVIDLELPWNPSRLDQRVGRVDRIGQHRRVHALHLLHAGSIEEQVLAHLYRRAARAAHLSALSDTTATDIEARVAEAIFAGAPTPTLAPSQPHTEPAPAAIDEVHRLEMLRRLTVTSLVHTNGEVVPVCLPRRSAGAISELQAAFRVALSDRVGRIVITTIVPITVTLSRAPLRSHSSLLTRVVELPSLQALVLATAEDGARASQVAIGTFSQSVVRRLEALQTMLQHEAEQLYQPALFEARPPQAVADRAAVRTAHRAHFEHLSDLLRDLEDTTLQSAVPLGIWLS